MRTLLLFLFLAPIFARAERPNIVFVLFDDMAWSHPQSYDPESALRTPNLDRLASEGMRFTDAHSASAVCTPTRYGVLTGRHPSRIGQFGVLTSYSKPIIPTTRLTVASMLQAEGYLTACVGKWHLGVNWEEKNPGRQDQLPLGARFTDGPNALGFDYFCGFTHARNIGSILEQNAVIDHVEPVENQPLMLEKAVGWIDAQAENDAPFFLYFPMCPPHTPIVPSPEFVGTSGATDVVKNDPGYGDWVYQGDAMLGALMATLERHGMAENTLVIATADNGAEQRTYPPLRDSKRSIYEGGHRVPFVVRWPGKVSPGSVDDAPASLTDFMATAAAITGATVPDDAAEDSENLLPRLLGKGSAHTPFLMQSMKGDLALRDGSWKAVFHKNGKRELFDLSTDLSEAHDLASEQPDELARLTRLMEKVIADGRSTPGPPQENDHVLQLP